jgi:hypothetical protein
MWNQNGEEGGETGGKDLLELERWQFSHLGTSIH